jgi:hypothetical protein
MAGNQQKSRLTRSQEAALLGLLTQPTIGLAAAQAKVGERTITRWLAEDEAFKSEYLRIRQEIVNNAVFQLQKATNNAVNSLISVMNDPEAPASARVRAATAVLEQALRALETEGLEERIAVLEQAYGSRGPNVNKLSARGRWGGPHYE